MTGKNLGLCLQIPAIRIGSPGSPGRLNLEDQSLSPNDVADVATPREVQPGSQAGAIVRVQVVVRPNLTEEETFHPVLYANSTQDELRRFS